jgi:general secretion pathway protein D
MKRHFKPAWRLLALLALGLATAFQAQAQFQSNRGGGNRGGASSSSTRTYPSNGTIGDAYFSIDPETRRVVVMADQDTTKYVSEVLSNLDRPKPQVLIKVVFLEVTYANGSDIGIEGGWARNIGDSTKANAADVFGLSALNTVATNAALNALGQPISSFQNASGPISSPGAGLFQILGQDYQVTLRAIAQAQSAKILSRPSILARNNQPATISVGEEVPLIQSTRYDNYGNVINNVNYTEVGVILTVTPFITADGLVEMIIQPEISSVDQTLQTQISANVSVPAIKLERADTVAVVPDGQTVIIGGLMQDSKIVSETKIPFLGDIPVLGNLFKRKQKSDGRQELLIFLTPHVVPIPTELASVSEREKAHSDAPKAFPEKELDKFLDSLPNKEPAKHPARRGK